MSRLPTFKVKFHTSVSVTIVNITVNSNFLGGNWSRPSGNTARSSGHSPFPAEDGERESAGRHRQWPPAVHGRPSQVDPGTQGTSYTHTGAGGDDHTQGQSYPYG